MSDVTQAHALVDGEETDVLGDTGYLGVDKRDDTQEIGARWHVAMRAGKRRTLDTATPLG